LPSRSPLSNDAEIAPAIGNSGIASGSALLLGTAVGESVGGHSDLRSIDLRDSPGVGAIPFASGDITLTSGTSGRVSVSLSPEIGSWRNTDNHRFRQLATKRATGNASDKEQLEFKDLQQRRRLHYVGSPDDLLAEWRRRKFVSEVLDVLTRNVSFFKAEDQARLRSLNQT
jgi:hypothetical protein